MCEGCILVHTEARWLSKRKVNLLPRVNEFHERFCKYLYDEFWMSKVEYNKLFGHLNSLNSNIQGRNENILTSIDESHVVAIKKVYVSRNRV